MLNRVQHIVQKFDHILLLGALVSMIASPIWEAVFTGGVLWSKLSIIIVLISGLSITYTHNRSGNYVFQIIGMGVIIVTFLSSFIGFGPKFQILANYLQVGYFLYLAITTLQIIIRSRRVTSEVVINSISGYFLIGLGWSIAISMWVTYFPESFSFTKTLDDGFYNAFYFSFVTMTTLGYGDILPLTSAAKALSILISISGAFYTTIVLGMIVGKYISTQSQNFNS